ncbi:hypothetical protein D9C73_016807 [Collichthys lucidus]|uniref:Uncharacterized protein n=1 Tax=Collichthys lucidus TaxID=240159 RepID=A0A4U5V570_COLLU|nr:hypothetical protein D9C73_016807 [Collichthys lucidus]
MAAMQAAVRCVSCNSEVMESVSHYSCCKAELQFKGNCEATFTANGTNFAFFKDETRSCTSPCRRLEDGVMRLEECAAVVGVMKMNVVEEKIQYRSRPCPVSRAAGNQGSVRLLLLASMFVTLAVKKLVC